MGDPGNGTETLDGCVQCLASGGGGPFPVLKIVLTVVSLFVLVSCASSLSEDEVRELIREETCHTHAFFIGDGWHEHPSDFYYGIRGTETHWDSDRKTDAAQPC